MARPVGRARIRAGCRRRTQSNAIEPKLARTISDPAIRSRLCSIGLIAGEQSAERLRDSIESAFAAGGGAAVVLVEVETEDGEAAQTAEVLPIDDRHWRRIGVQHRAAVRPMRNRLSGPGAATIQFQSAAGSVPRMRGFRQHRGDRHGPRRSRSRQNRFATARSRRGMRRPTRTNSKNCSRSPTTTSCRSTCRSPNSPKNSGD